ncbi:MAG: sulfotransferase [Pseudomonadota bacterium]
MLSPPTLPFTVRAGNALFTGLRAFGVQRNALDKAALLAAARSQTGLADFGDSSFEAGLDRLLRALAEEAQLTPLGTLIAREEILAPLSQRLQLVEHHRRYPEIAAAPIDKPIFIIGMGRSGTTVLHELLALDPQFRVPRTWEVDRPFPPPETASYEHDPRIAEIQRTLDRADFILPEFKRIHRTGATLPQECVRFTTGEFLSLIFWTNYNVPSYSNWLQQEADLSAAYRYHRSFLQLLQWRHQRSPWVLKSPAHLWSLGELLAEYPDARFIQTHRDPVRMLASLSSLVTHLRKMSTNAVDGLQIAQEWAQWNALGLNASAEFRESGAIAPGQVVDLDFYQFMDDPVVEVEKIYRHFDLELRDTVRQSMQDYLAAHAADEHGSHRYSFADTGLNLDEERERLGRYQNYFGTRNEVTA